MRYRVQVFHRHTNRYLLGRTFTAERLPIAIEAMVNAVADASNLYHLTRPHLMWRLDQQHPVTKVWSVVTGNAPAPVTVLRSGAHRG